MEIVSLISPENFINLRSLEYLNSCGVKYFIHRKYQKKQRLIPLTREIEKAMINFNGSESDTSSSERHIFNTKSMMSLVRNEVYNILQKLPNSEQLARREEIDDIIKNSFQNCDGKLQHVILHDTNDEFEITVKDVTEDQDKTMLLVESIQKLEHRIAKLEKRTKLLIKNVPKTKQFKFNISAIKARLNNSLNKTNSLIKIESLKKLDDKTTHNYDDLFYRTREYTLNLLNYKKSLESLELNQSPKWNPYVKPAYDVLASQETNIKKLSMFLPS